MLLNRSYCGQTQVLSWNSGLGDSRRVVFSYGHGSGDGSAMGSCFSRGEGNGIGGYRALGGGYDMYGYNVWDWDWELYIRENQVIVVG